MRQTTVTLTIKCPDPKVSNSDFKEWIRANLTLDEMCEDNVLEFAAIENYTEIEGFGPIIYTSEPD